MLVVSIHVFGLCAFCNPYNEIIYNHMVSQMSAMMTCCPVTGLVFELSRFGNLLVSGDECLNLFCILYLPQYKVKFIFLYCLKFVY
jgi:hypothetical protein